MFNSWKRYISWRYILIDQLPKPGFTFLSFFSWESMKVLNHRPYKVKNQVIYWSLAPVIHSFFSIFPSLLYIFHLSFTSFPPFLLPVSFPYFSPFYFLTSLFFSFIHFSFTWYLFSFLSLPSVLLSFPLSISLVPLSKIVQKFQLAKN